MKIINAKVEIYEEKDNLKKIETIARCCTGTESKIGSNPDFIENLLQRGHMTPFEHVRVKISTYELVDMIAKCIVTPYGVTSRASVHFSGSTINGRDFLALAGTVDKLKSMPQSDDYCTLKFVVDIGMSRELIRHRQFSFMERSTRYVNFKDGIEFIRPEPCAWSYDKYGDLVYGAWISACDHAEHMYCDMIKNGCKPQEARYVLPLSTSTILYMTGTYSQWEEFLTLRLGSGVHPALKHLLNTFLDNNATFLKKTGYDRKG